MLDAVRFFSSLQSGLSTSVVERADVNGIPPAGQAVVEPKLRISGIDRRFSQEMILRGPSDVMRLDPDAISSVEPSVGERDVAPNFFPYVELKDAALPWAFTPAVPNANGRLMPWLVLVVVPKLDTVSVKRLTSTPGMCLSINEGAGALLPVLSEAYAWAHVEDRSGASNAVNAYAARPSDFISRLMCPIKMNRNAAYIAALVPAFEAGRQAGLGRTVTDTGNTLAWNDTTESLDLPVFHQWEFTTGSDDFEALVRKLRGVPVDNSVGLKDLDISKPEGGLNISSVLGARNCGKSILVSYQGALLSPVAKPRKWPGDHKVPFEKKLKSTLLPKVSKPKSRNNYSAVDHDPVIAPPIYGSFQKDRSLFENSRARWMSEVNLDPQNRSNSGLGVRTVQHHQEELMGKAYARAKNVTEVHDFLRRSRIALAVGTQVHEKLSQLPANQYLQVTTAVQPKVAARKGSSQSVAAQLSQIEAIPEGVLSSAFRRNAVTTQTRVKSISQSPKSTITLQIQATQTSMSGQVATFQDRLPALNIGARPLTEYAVNGVLLSPELSLERLAAKVGISMVPFKGSAIGTVLKDPVFVKKPKLQLEIVDRIGKMTRRTKTVRKIARSTVSTNSNTIKSTLQAATQPIKVLPKIVNSRVTGLGKVPANRVEIPRSVHLSVSFEEPAYEFLRSNGVEFLLPGFGAIVENSVSLLVTNASFVDSYLLGLNHEMSREFAWRQFPAPLNQTWFKRFWNYLGETPKNDITGIEKWPDKRRLGDGQSANDSVVLVKSPLFRRYPDTLVYAVPAVWTRLDKLDPQEVESLQRTDEILANGKVRIANFSNPKKIVHPSFSGRIGTSASFFGFPESPATMVGTPNPETGKGDAGYFVVFEQALKNQKFGLDQALTFTPTNAPSSANDLTWGHFAESQEALDQLPHARTQTGWDSQMIDNAKWGRSAADTAKLTLQSPVRIMFHASGLMNFEGVAT